MSKSALCSHGKLLSHIRLISLLLWWGFRQLASIPLYEVITSCIFHSTFPLICIPPASGIFALTFMIYSVMVNIFHSYLKVTFCMFKILQDISTFSLLTLES